MGWRHGGKGYWDHMRRGPWSNDQDTAKTSNAGGADAADEKKGDKKDSKDDKKDGDDKDGDKKDGDDKDGDKKEGDGEKKESTGIPELDAAAVGTQVDTGKEAEMKMKEKQ